MIRKLIMAFFNTLLTLVMTLVQLICLPLNLIFEGLFPDFSSYISKIQEALDFIFESIGWAINLIPPFARTTFLFIFTVELAMLAVMKSTHATAKAWNLLQKIKFW